MTEAPTSGSDDDLAAIHPTPMAKAAGFVAAATGAFTLVLTVQTALIWIFRGLPAVAICLMGVAGATSVVCGWMVTKVRGWAAVGATASCGVTAILAPTWFVYAIMSGVFSLLAMAIFPFAAAGAVLAALRIGPGRRADQARARLADSGLDAGI